MLHFRFELALMLKSQFLGILLSAIKINLLDLFIKKSLEFGKVKILSEV